MHYHFVLLLNREQFLLPLPFLRLVDLGNVGLEGLVGGHIGLRVG